MSDRKQHYGVKFYAPHPNSLLAFLVTASEIIDNDPSAEPWMKPVEITDDMPRAAADWARRKNPMLEEYDGAFRQRAFRSLMRIGITADALANPTPQLAEMVETLVYEQRLHEAVESDLRGPTRTHSAYFSRAARMAAGVLFQTVGANKSAEWREVADILNDGIPNGKKGLMRDHIKRAEIRYRADLHRVVNGPVARSEVSQQDFLLAECVGLSGTIRGLRSVYALARKRIEFKRLTGHDLAVAIHRKYDMNARFHRAIELVDQHRKAA